eukprot:763916-Hanusia_phi.AAC.14
MNEDAVLQGVKQGRAYLSRLLHEACTTWFGRQINYACSRIRILEAALPRAWHHTGTSFVLDR